MHVGGQHDGVRGGPVWFGHLRGTGSRSKHVLILSYLIERRYSLRNRTHVSRTCWSGQPFGFGVTRGVHLSPRMFSDVLAFTRVGRRVYIYPGDIGRPSSTLPKTTTAECLSAAISSANSALSSECSRIHSSDVRPLLMVDEATRFSTIRSLDWLGVDCALPLTLPKRVTRM